MFRDLISRFYRKVQGDEIGKYLDSYCISTLTPDPNLPWVPWVAVLGEIAKIRNPEDLDPIHIYRYIYIYIDLYRYIYIYI